MKKFKIYFKAIEPEELTVDANSEGDAIELATKAYMELLNNGGYVEIDSVVEIHESDEEGEDNLNQD